MQLEREAIGRIKGKMRCKAKQGPRSSSRAQQPPIILQSARGFPQFTMNAIGKLKLSNDNQIVL